MIGITESLFNPPLSGNAPHSQAELPRIYIGPFQKPKMILHQQHRKITYVPGEGVAFIFSFPIGISLASYRGSRRTN